MVEYSAESERSEQFRNQAHTQPTSKAESEEVNRLAAHMKELQLVSLHT